VLKVLVLWRIYKRVMVIEGILPEKKGDTS